jgi:hypothetical protein
MAKFTRFAKVYEECFPTLPNELIDIIHSFAPIMGSFLTDIKKVNKVYTLTENKEGRVIDWSNELSVDTTNKVWYYRTTSIYESFIKIMIYIGGSNNYNGIDFRDIPNYNKIHITYSIFMEKGKNKEIDFPIQHLRSLLYEIAGIDEVVKMLRKPKLIQMMKKISKQKVREFNDLSSPQLIYAIRYALTKY